MLLGLSAALHAHYYIVYRACFGTLRGAPETCVFATRRSQQRAHCHMTTLSPAHPNTGQHAPHVAGWSAPRPARGGRYCNTPCTPLSVVYIQYIVYTKYMILRGPRAAEWSARHRARGRRCYPAAARCGRSRAPRSQPPCRRGPPT